MLKSKQIKLKLFAILAAVQTIFALIILFNELMAINNRIPGGNFPIEHQYSWARVVLFCGVAVISLIVAWVINSREAVDDLANLPTLKSVFLLAALPTAFSILFHHSAFIGWCCEQPVAFFFGFPFSFLLGVDGIDYSFIRQFANYSLFEILANPELHLAWRLEPYRLLLNLLFYSNLSFILLNLVFQLIQKGRLARENERKVI